MICRHIEGEARSAGIAPGLAPFYPAERGPRQPAATETAAHPFARHHAKHGTQPSSSC